MITDLIAKLTSLTGAPVQQDFESGDQPQPRIWIQRTQGNDPLFLSGNDSGPGEYVFAVEIAGIDPSAVDALQSLCTAIWDGVNGLHGFRGVLGSTRVLALFIEDASDQYESRQSLNLDDGWHVAGFNMRVIA